MMYLWKAYTAGLRLHWQDVKNQWIGRFHWSKERRLATVCRLAPYVLVLLLGVVLYDALRALEWVSVPVWVIPSTVLAEHGLGEVRAWFPSLASASGDTHALVFRVKDLVETVGASNSLSDQIQSLTTACLKDGTCLRQFVSFQEAWSWSLVQRPPEALSLVLAAKGVGLHLPAVSWASLVVVLMVEALGLFPLVVLGQQALRRAQQPQQQALRLAQWMRVAIAVGGSVVLALLLLGWILTMTHGDLTDSLFAVVFGPLTTVIVAAAIGMWSLTVLSKKHDAKWERKVQSNIDRGFTQMEHAEIGRAMTPSRWKRWVGARPSTPGGTQQTLLSEKRARRL